MQPVTDPHTDGTSPALVTRVADWSSVTFPNRSQPGTRR